MTSLAQKVVSSIVKRGIMCPRFTISLELLKRHSRLCVMEIEIQTILISSGHNYYGRYGKEAEDYAIVEKEAVELVAGSGIVDDRFFNYKEDYKGQLTFFSDTTLEAVRTELGYEDAEFKDFRRNMILKGVAAEELIGKIFRIGELEFTGSCEAAPCFWMNQAVGEGTHEFLKGRGGLRARITKGGVLKTGVHKLEILGEIEIDNSK